MKIFERRYPIARALLFAATFGVVMGVAAIVSGDAVLIGRNGSRTQHFLKSQNQPGFMFLVRLYFGGATLCSLLAFLRVSPLEDGWTRFWEEAYRRMQRMGYDKKAPLWAYAFLVGVIALVIWIGKMTMYSE